MYEDSCCAVACTSPAPCLSDADAGIGYSPESSSSCPSPAYWMPPYCIPTSLGCAMPPDPCGDLSGAYDSSGLSECEVHCEHPGVRCGYPCAPDICEAPAACCAPPPSIFVKPPCAPPDNPPGSSIYYKVSAYPQDCSGGGPCAKTIKIEPQVCCAPTYEPCNDLKRDVFVLKIAKKNECEEQREDLHLELRTPKRHPMGPPPFRADEETQCTPDDFAPPKPPGKGKHKGKGKKKKKKK